MSKLISRYLLLSDLSTALISYSYDTTMLQQTPIWGLGSSGNRAEAEGGDVTEKSRVHSAWMDMQACSTAADSAAEPELPVSCRWHKDRSMLKMEKRNRSAESTEHSSCRETDRQAWMKLVMGDCPWVFQPPWQEFPRRHEGSAPLL